MSEYITNEALMQKPDGWIDGSTNIAQFPGSEHLIRFVIVRGMVVGRTLEQYVDAQTKELAKRMPFFEVTQTEERTAAGQRGIFVKCVSREPAGEMATYRFAFRLGDQFMQLMLMAKATGDKEAAGVFDRALATMKLRDPAAAT